jgi:hypothetical protein
MSFKLPNSKELAHFLLAIVDTVTVLGQAVSHNRKEKLKKAKDVDGGGGDQQGVGREANWKPDTASLTVAKHR